MFISDYTKPIRFIDTVNTLASSIGTPTVPEQLSDELNANVSPFMASGSSTTLGRVISKMAEHASVKTIDEVDDDTFCYIEGDVMPVQNDDKKFCFKFADGYIVLTRNTHAFSSNASIDDMNVLECIVLSCAMKMSQRDRYLLMRYNDIAMVSNAAFAGGSYTDASTARYSGDMWKLFDGVLCEMRSVVVDLSCNEIVSLPFYKFRNLGECEAYMPDKVNDAIAKAAKVEVTDKMDGSFVQMRYIGDDTFRSDGMLVSTSGSLNRETNEHLQVVHSLIDEKESARFADLCRNNPTFTFIYEFIMPEIDPHIVQYDESRWGLYLLSARDVNTGRVLFQDELDEISSGYSVARQEKFDGMTMEEIADICSSADVSEREGFVVNIDGWMVKCKLDEFCLISKLVHGASNFNVIIANVARGTMDDLLAKIPLVYHDSLIEQARELLTYDADAHYYIETMVKKAIEFAGTDNIKEAVAFINENVIAPFRGFVIDYYKTGEHDGDSYLYKNPRHPMPSLLKENAFMTMSQSLRSAIEALN